jgi:hypothetical protein
VLPTTCVNLLWMRVQAEAEHNDFFDVMCKNVPWVHEFLTIVTSASQGKEVLDAVDTAYANRKKLIEDNKLTPGSAMFDMLTQQRAIYKEHTDERWEKERREQHKFFADMAVIAAQHFGSGASEMAQWMRKQTPGTLAAAVANLNETGTDTQGPQNPDFAVASGELASSSTTTTGTTGQAPAINVKVPCMDMQKMGSDGRCAFSEFYAALDDTVSAFIGRAPIFDLKRTSVKAISAFADICKSHHPSDSSAGTNAHTIAMAAFKKESVKAKHRRVMCVHEFVGKLYLVAFHRTAVDLTKVVEDESNKLKGVAVTVGEALPSDYRTNGDANANLVKLCGVFDTARQAHGNCTWFHLVCQIEGKTKVVDAFEASLGNLDSKTRKWCIHGTSAAAKPKKTPQ